MLPHIRRRIQHSRCRPNSSAWNRHSSSFPVKYHPKVRALPFVVSPEEAINATSLTASFSLLRDGYYSEVLSSLVARCLPATGMGKVYQPTQLKLVYFPTWVVDGWASFGTSERNEDGTVYLGIDHSYIPGTAVEPLSRMVLADPADEHFKPVPFTNDLRKQHDHGVMCLPYTYTPNELPSWLRTLYAPNRTGGYDSRSLHAMFTWYPVLVPVYLAKYEGTINGETSSIIMVLEAYRKEGAHFLDISGMHAFFKAQELKAMKLLGKASIDENLRESLLPEPSQAIRSESVSRAGIDDELLSGGAKIQHRFREALNSLVTWKDAWTKYERFWKEQRQRTHLRPEDFDDPRILEYPGFESDNRHFSLGSFFREVVAAKITLALSKEDERFGRLMLPRVWITLSFRALTQPEGGYKIESDGVSQAHITFTLNVDRDRLAHLKMPIIINLLHADNLLGQIHATVVSSHTASSSRPPDTTEAEGPMKTLYVAIKWDEQDTPEEEARQSATMFMHYMMETVPWAAKWEEENSRI